MISAFIGTEAPQQTWPRIEAAHILEDGQSLGVFVREFDGSISAVRIGVEQLAD